MAVCWFCPDGQGNSPEHMFPDWLNDVIPGQEGPPYDLRELQKTPAGEATREWVKPGPAKEVVKTVCRKCNTGWMATLEGRVIPQLSPIVRGQACALTPEAALLVATWAVKTALVIESRNPPQQIVSTTAERQLFARERRPLADMQVDIFAYEGEALTSYKRHAAGVKRASQAEDEEQANFSVTSILVGLCGLRVVHDKSGMHTPLTGRRVRIADGVATVWPPSDRLVWPPGRRLTDDDVEALHIAALPDQAYW